jgi:glucose/arabinose dehydrogenase
MPKQKNGEEIMRTLSIAIGVVIAAGGAAGSQESLQKLQNMQTTGTALEIPTISQTGKNADNLRKIAEKIKVPPGFKAELFAIVPDARHMAVGRNVGTVFVGTRKSKAYAVTDRDKDGVADEVKDFAPSVAFKVPNGMCYSNDGFLFVAEHNRVLVFPAAEFFYESPDVAIGVVAEQLIPASEESFNHGARVCAIGPDNKLYISLGQPHNVPPKGKLALYKEHGIGGIIRMDRDGKNREIYVDGVRNSVGIAFSPQGQLWFTDNQVDGMGDDIPPGEINRVTKQGQNFGFPWYGGGKVRTTEYKGDEIPADVVAPEHEMAAHAADLGMTFYTAQAFPDKYRGGLFTAQHGSWNRTKPVGARVMFTPIKADGTSGKPEVFADGWLDEGTGQYLGRPVDVKVYLDGSLLVSDDLTGAIWRISPES